MISRREIVFETELTPEQCLARLAKHGTSYTLQWTGLRFPGTLAYKIRGNRIRMYVVGARFDYGAYAPEFSGMLLPDPEGARLCSSVGLSRSTLASIAAFFSLWCIAGLVAMWRDQKTWNAMGIALSFQVFVASVLYGWIRLLYKTRENDHERIVRLIEKVLRARRIA